MLEIYCEIVGPIINPYITHASDLNLELRMECVVSFVSCLYLERRLFREGQPDIMLERGMCGKY